MELISTKNMNSELGVIPENWDVVNLGDIAKIVGGSTPKTNDLRYWNGAINWFTPTEIGTQKYVTESKRTLSEMGLNACSVTILPVGAILLTSRAGIGDLAILTEEACTNQGFQSLIPSENVYGEFLYYLISSKKGELLKYASGSTFLEISPSKVRAIKLPLPPFSEQTAIATALSDMDALISNLEKLIEKKRMIKQGAMQELLKPKEGWEVKSLGNLTKIFTKQTGFDYTAYIKPSLVQEKKVDTIPFIQNKDFNNRWINFNTDYFIPRTIAIQFPKILLDEKALLISISGSVGNVGLFDSQELAFIGGAIAVLKFKNPDLIDWVMFYLKSIKGQKVLLNNVKAGSHQNLILDDIRKIEIPFPTIQQQTYITKILTNMDLELSSLESMISKYTLIKQGMMQSLLTGRVRLI